MPEGKGIPGVRHCVVTCELELEARADAKGWLLDGRVRTRAGGLHRTVSAVVTAGRSRVRTFTQTPWQRSQVMSSITPLSLNPAFGS